MNVSPRHRVALLASLVGSFMFTQASAAPGADGEIRFRGAIVEAAQCQTTVPAARPSTAARLSVHCEREQMRGRVTASLETVSATAAHGRLVWSRMDSASKAILLHQASETENLYRVTLTYL